MRAEQIKARVESDHRLIVDLSSNVPTGEVEVIVLYPDAVPAAVAASPTPSASRKNLAAFTEWLDKQPPSQRSREDMDQQIAEERESWS